MSSNKHEQADLETEELNHNTTKEMIVEDVRVTVIKTATLGPTEQVQLVYCGPNLQRGILNQYIVFRGSGLPKHLDQHIANCPAIRRLFVTPDLLNKTNQAISTTGTPQNVWFREIQEYVRGGVK